MKAYLGVLVALPFLLGGCGSAGPKDPGPKPKCAGETSSPVVIHTGPPTLFVSPDNKKAHRGKHLRFMAVAPNNLPITVSSPRPWLNFSAPRSEFPILVCIPAGEPLGEVKYDVQYDGVILDPRVDVIP